MNRTLMLIKPDAVRRRLIGRILQMVEGAGLEIRGLRMLRLTPDQARRFYSVHEGRPFLDSLVVSMSSGPVVALVLEADEAIPRLRTLAGATDPTQAAQGTIRRAVGLDIEQNSMHASDSPESALRELAFFELDLSWSKT